MNELTDVLDVGAKPDTFIRLPQTGIYKSFLKRSIKRALPDWLVLIREYRKKHGEFPNILNPQKFNEKVLHRMLFDRRQILTQLADKAASRAYIEQRIGFQYLPKLYYLTTNPETIPYERLPNKFIVKPTHGSGWIRIVHDKSKLNYAELTATCKKWLRRSYYKQSREWVYKDIVPQILVEEYVDDGSGNEPNDYKLFVFDGTVRFIRAITGHFTNERKRSYDRNWQKLDVAFEYDVRIEDVARPPHFDEMIRVAETLGKGMDFVRVDMYDTPAKLYCGEITTTPDGSLQIFRPPEFNRQLGDYWKLPRGK